MPRIFSSIVSWTLKICGLESACVASQGQKRDGGKAASLPTD